MTITLRVPTDFNFWSTVHSHGWSSLPPFHVNKEEKALERILELSNEKIILLRIAPRTSSSLTIDVECGSVLSQQSRKEIIASVTSSFRLGEDYSVFYTEARKHKPYRWIPKTGAGRLLRAPTVFEDAVKMICTTNCSWALTEIMTENLCRKLGSGFQNERFTFPKPEAIADATEKFLRKEIRVGYRAPYLMELSRNIVKGKVNIEKWRTSTLPTEELFEAVRSVKGIGPYAAGNILKLLGRYDYLGIDSWCRKQFFAMYKNGRKISDRTIEKFYHPYAEWRGLFFWMDVTKHWYDKEFPF